MDRKFSVAIATLMLAAVSACSRSGPPPASATTAAPVPAVAVPAPVVSAADQAQVEALAFIVAIDEQEVAAAEQARGKKVDADILAYADLLHEAHSANLDQTHAIADAAGLLLKDDADVMALRTRGMADLERLAALDEEDYTQAYLTAMVDGHAEALALIDQRLLPAVTRAEIRQHLLATRVHVEQHLQAAKDLQTRHLPKPKPRAAAKPAPVPPVAEPTAPEPTAPEPPDTAPAAETDVHADHG